MSKIAIIMGSKSDLEVMNEAVNMLKEFGIEHEMKVLSAHRAPKDVAEYSENAAANGFKVIIAGAGAAAALPGVIAAHTTLPVIGVPIDSTSLKGIDALLSIVQMPSGIPVACMAIGKTGAKNAGLFAIEILAAGDKALEKKLQDYKKELADKVKSTKF